MALALTPHPDVNLLIQTLLSRAQPILGARLVGMYLYGSLSLGDFDPDSSDVDFLFVTDGDLPLPTLDALAQMHAEIAASGLPYAQKLEGSYIPAAALRRYDPADALHPSIGVDWAFGVGQHGMNWILERHIVRTREIVVWGPPPASLIDPVPADDLRAAACDMLANFWRQQLDHSDWLRPRDYQAFAALTMCRALYTIRKADVASKPQAAAWARQQFPAWRWIIDRALEWRHQHEPDDLDDTLGFVRFALEYADGVCG